MKRYLRVALLAGACALALSGCDWFLSVEERVARAEKLVATGDDRGAAIELKNALGSKPDNVPARLLLARVSLRQGDTQSAQKELEVALQNHAPAREAAEIEADIQLASGKTAALLASLDSGKSALDATTAAIYRGLAQLANRDLDASVAAFNAALALTPTSTRARLGLGEALAQRGDFDAAMAEAAKVRETAPDDAHAWLLEGRIQGRRGQFKESSAALGSARRNAAGQLAGFEYDSLLSALVESLIASGSLPEARATLDELARREPDAPLVNLLGARIAMAQQNYPLAVTEAQKVVAAAPDNPLAKLVLGAALLANGNYNQAEARLAELVRQAPENLEARKLLADTNLRLKRPDVAMQLLSQAQQSGVSDPQVESLLAWANLQRGDQAGGIELLERSAASQPANSSIKLDLALAYFTAGKYQQAIDLLDSIPASTGTARREQLLIAAVAGGKTPQAATAEVEKIVNAQPRDLGVLNIAASFYARNRDYARARELMRSAIAIEPRNTGSLSTAARIELQSGDDTAAGAALQALLAVDPSSQYAHVALAQLAMRRNDVASATQQLEAARAGDATAVEPRLLLAAQYLRDRKTREADEILRELTALSENDPPVAVVTGRLYAQAGRYDEALRQLRAAAEREPRNASWLIEVARVQMARGDAAGTRDSLQKALAIDPDSVTANALMTAVELKEGKKDQALARVARVRKAHPDDATAALLEGDVSFAQGDFTAAARSFDDAYRMTPSSGAAIRIYRARVAGHLPAPTAALSAWLQKQPRDITARLVLAQSLLEQGASKASIGQYERVIADGAPGAMALNNLAWLYQQVHDPRAEATAKRAYELAPEVPEIADTYAWILVEAGRATDALPILERAAGAKGASSDTRFHYAAALAKAGRKDDARTALRRLLASPGFPRAAEVRQLLTGLGDPP